MIISPGVRGVDYAFGRPTPDTLKRHGYRFVVRYISVPPASPAKNLTAAERDVLLDAGVGVLLVWEMSSTSPDQGARVGAAHGAAAKGKARELGYPLDVPILVAVDTDTYGRNIDAHEGYVRGFATMCAPYSIGVYGDADILLRIGTLSKIGWLPNASAWSSANKTRAIDAGLVHVLQRRQTTIDGIAVDPNDVIAPIPVWSKTEPSPPPAPAPPPAPVHTTAAFAAAGGADMYEFVADASKKNADDGVRWLSNDMVRTRPTFEHASRLIRERKVSNTLDNPKWLTPDELAGLPLVNG